MGKVFLKQIRPYVALYRDPNSGIAWIENGSTGNGHSAHPNIDRTGSIAGMKKRHWGENAVTVRSHGFIYCTSRFSCSDGLDYIAALHCQCGQRHTIGDLGFALLLAEGYYDGPHGPDAFKRDVLREFLGPGSQSGNLDRLLDKHRDQIEKIAEEFPKRYPEGFIAGQRAWLQKALDAWTTNLVGAN